MGTGGPSPQSTPTYFLVNKKVSKENFNPAWCRNVCEQQTILNNHKLDFASCLPSAPREKGLRTLKTEQSNRHPPSKRLHSFYALNLRLRSSPRLISTGQLHTLLHFHLRPIYDIVYIVPYSSRDERSYLRESFTLRCFQRLSRPHLATLLCRWHDNRCTRGASIPVLSY